MARDPSSAPKAGGNQRHLGVMVTAFAVAVVGVLVAVTIRQQRPAGSLSEGTPTAAPTSAAPTLSPSTEAEGWAAQIRDWYTSGGKDNLRLITANAGQVRDAAAAGDMAATAQACGNLGDSARLALGYEAVPDYQAQTDWAALLADVRAAASKCQTGAANQDAALLDQASMDVLAGLGVEQRLISRLTLLGTDAGGVSG